MREILFRGKNIDNLKWVYGFFIQNEDGKCYIKNTDYNVNNGRINVIPYEVIPETVGQYTGLKDKNGVKIFEGDKVLVPYNGIGVKNVSFFEGCFNITRYSISKIEVIGNTHDNK